MSEMNQVLQAIVELSNKMDEQYQSLSGKIDGLERRMDSLEIRMDSLEKRMNEHGEKTEKNHQLLLEKLDSINEQIAILAHDNVTTKGDVRLLKKKIGMLDY